MSKSLRAFLTQKKNMWARTPIWKILGAAFKCWKISNFQQDILWSVDIICFDIIKHLFCKQGKTEYLRNYQLPNPRTYISSKGYTFVKGQTGRTSTLSFIICVQVNKVLVARDVLLYFLHSILVQVLNQWFWGMILLCWEIWASLK